VKIAPNVLISYPCLTRPSLKQNQQKIAKINVLRTGTIIEVIIDPTKSFLFLKGMKHKPPIKPATVVLTKHVATVAPGLIDINTFIVLGEQRTITPEANPKNPPAKGPTIIDPKTIGINERLIFTVPGIIEQSN